jgi:hypothetical protein
MILYHRLLSAIPELGNLVPELSPDGCVVEAELGRHGPDCSRLVRTNDEYTLIRFIHRGKERRHGCGQEKRDPILRSGHFDTASPRNPGLGGLHLHQEESSWAIDKLNGVIRQGPLRSERGWSKEGLVTVKDRRGDEEDRLSTLTQRVYVSQAPTLPLSLGRSLSLIVPRT